MQVKQVIALSVLISVLLCCSSQCQHSNYAIFVRSYSERKALAYM